jgi:REP element-mobilizing transposase RayT
VAVPGARYFVTAVTRERKSGLADFPLWAKLLEQAACDEADVHALVVMPDHLHCLFVLSEATEPGDVVRRLKGPCAPILRGRELRWQKNYFEHRLRPEESSESYLRYMLSNPHRAELVSPGERWPFWAITSPNAAWFVRKYPKQTPEPAWLALEKPWLMDTDEQV